MNLDNGHIRQLRADELPRAREVKLSPEEFKALDPLPAEERPDAYRAMQLRAALALIKRVRDVTGVQLKVFRMNESDMVAAITRDRAMDWFYKTFSRPTSPPVKELSLHTTVKTPDGEQPLWFLVADHFRRVLKDYTPGAPLPEEMLAPFMLYTSAKDAEGGEGE